MALQLTPSSQQRRSRTLGKISSLVESISPRSIRDHPYQSPLFGRPSADETFNDDDDYDDECGIIIINTNNNNDNDNIHPDVVHALGGDSDSDCESGRSPGGNHLADNNGNSDNWELPELPSLYDRPRPPSNYICPLTLQLMEDPVHDSCGHTFERRAMLEWLKGSSHEQAVCPISRKPLVPLGGRESASCGEKDNDSCCYDRVLRRNKNLQRRIQEWKLKYPLYQGADPGYARQQREEMLSRSSSSNNASMQCSYGKDALDGNGNINNNPGRLNTANHHQQLSRFDLMLLPQEREVLESLQKQSIEKRERLDRSRRCLLAMWVLAIVVFLTVIYHQY